MDVDKKNVLIAGANGFLGYNLSAYLALRWNCYAVQRSFANEQPAGVQVLSWDDQELRGVLESKKFEAIINCVVSYNRDDRLSGTAELVKSNLVVPLRLLAYAVEYEIPMVVMFDSYYGKYPSVCQWMRQYRLSRQHQEQWCSMYSASLTLLTLALEHLYGPHDSENKFVHWLIRSLLRNESELGLSPGEQLRDFLYVSDLCALIELMLTEHNREMGLFRYAVGSGTTTSVKNFAEMCKRLTNSSTRLNFGAVPYREGELMSSCADIAPLRQLGWEPSVTLASGLSRLIQEIG